MLESVRAVPEVMFSLSHVPRAWWARRAGREDIERLQRERFSAIVRHARAHSAFYAAHYHGCRTNAAPQELPPVSRGELMAHFDAWVTDPAITYESVESFLADPDNVGRRFLDRHFVWTSSGTSGVPGVYVQDTNAMAVYDAMVALQVYSGGGAWRASQGWTMHGRGALIAATGGHYASLVTFVRMVRTMPWAQAKLFSILTPLPELCAELSAFHPKFLASYPTMLLLLAQEQRAGRLELEPDAIWAGGECLSPAAVAELESTFGCAVVEEYGASECMNVGFRCSEGWLHVNADWVLLEPVDREGRVVPPGVASHSVLLTNLANRVQPIIRYDLGDSILERPTPCECGSVLPAIRVEGRREDVLTLHDAEQRGVRLVPLAFDTVIEATLGGCPFQVVQTAHDALAIRVTPPPGMALDDAWTHLRPALRGWLDEQGLGNATLALDPTAPEHDASGKLRHVVRLGKHGDDLRTSGTTNSGRSA
jgi:phenylacetate-coenzyme A ligase PaaK-like adenylate-forming protein